jgi:hypothetical protein
MPLALPQLQTLNSKYILDLGQNPYRCSLKKCYKFKKKENENENHP